MSDTSRDVCQQLMSDASAAILAFMRKAEEKGRLATDVIVVRRDHAAVIAIGICDRATLSADPGGEFIPEQLEVLRRPPNPGEMQLYLFAGPYRGVGRITKKQMDDAYAAAFAKGGES